MNDATAGLRRINRLSGCVNEVKDECAAVVPAAGSGDKARRFTSPCFAGATLDAHRAAITSEFIQLAQSRLISRRHLEKGGWLGGVVAWIVTLPASALMATLCYIAVRYFLR